ncbi:RidA family protein [Alicyclobacillus fodiniaquatilis]|uniref:RidA family protein n=1 Tax=Alicyclobacillus fodiniaquatilis TaxID=1661150 RepID=A0ABW4JKK6_9BACL
MRVEAKLAKLGLVLPEQKLPTDLKIPFAWVRIYGNRAFVSGTGPVHADGTYTGPFGKVPQDVSEAEAYRAARLATLNILSNLKQAIGDLDRVEAWLIARGMVNAVPGFTKTTHVMNGFSDLILELYGPEAGKHARTAPGVVATPLNLPVVIEAEVIIRTQ